MSHTVESHPFFRGLRAPLHIAHRGGAKLFPENTLFAFSQAVQRYHTDMLELDVHATRDGVLVVAHDDTVERCSDGVGAIADLTWAELSALDFGYRCTPEGGTGFPFRGQGHRAPRFEEVLRAFPGMRLNVELKSRAALAPLLALVCEGAQLERLCLGSMHDELARELSEALPDACLFYPRDALTAFILPVKGGEAPEDDGRYTVLDLPMEWEGQTLLDADLTRAARARGKWINVWTVDEAERMREAFDLGAHGVMTDRPDLLRTEVDRRRAAALPA